MKQICRFWILLLAAVWSAGSAAAQHIVKSTHCFAVKDGQTLCLDRYAAAGEEACEAPHPCVMFVFGGGFAGGVRDAGKYLAYFERLASEGYDVVSIDYRLGMRDVHNPGVVEAVAAFRNTVDMAVEDLYDATRFVVEHSADWNIDPSKIVASGSSAGAITVLQAENGICNRTDAAKRLPENFNYGGVVSFAGAIFSMSGRPDWKSAPCPMLLFHGTADRNVPYRKGAVLGVGFYGSATIAEQLHEEGWPYYFYSVDYEDHSLAESPMTDNLELIGMFLREYVVGGRRMMTVEECCNEAHSNRKTDFSIFDYLGSNYGN